MEDIIKIGIPGCNPLLNQEFSYRFVLDELVSARIKFSFFLCLEWLFLFCIVILFCIFLIGLHGNQCSIFCNNGVCVRCINYFLYSVYSLFHLFVFYDIFTFLPYISLLSLTSGFSNQRAQGIFKIDWKEFVSIYQSSGWTLLISCES